MPRLTEKDWRSLRRSWEAGGISFAELARRKSIHPSTVARRARLQGWCKSDDAESPDAAARALYLELSKALRGGLATLADRPETEAPAQARERAALIRAHRRALAALIDADRKTKKHGDVQSEQPAGGTLDLESARLEVLRRLDRLEKT